MKTSHLIFIIISIIFVLFFLECESLRCRTDDGPTEEDIKKIVRICMRKVGENDTDSDYSDEEDSDSDEKPVEVAKNSRNNSQNNFSGFNFQGNYQTDPYMNNNNNWNDPNSQNNFGGMHRGFGGQVQNQNQNQNFNPNQNMGYGNSFNSTDGSNDKNNQTEQDRACLVHCFFHELKMTNNEDFPDKRKVLQVLTKDIREKEVREFYVDSIQECFHMVDNMDNYNKRKNKCDVSYTLVTCLTERAKTNCEDFQENMMLF